jgi:hypothetical protein
MTVDGTGLGAARAETTPAPGRWRLRSARWSDAALIEQLVERGRAAPLSSESPGAIELITAFPVLRLLFRDGEAVGLCAMACPPPRRGGSARDLQIRLVVLVVRGLSEGDAALATDRLVAELGRSCAMGLP